MHRPPRFSPMDRKPTLERAPKAHRAIDILAPDEVRALLQACSRRAPTGIRNRALIATIYGAGLRVSEALALRPKDVDLAALAVTVQSGKGGRRRVAALLPDAVDAVDRWLDRRAQMGLGAQHPLFCTISRGASGPHATAPGRPLGREYVARRLKQLARKAGLVKRIHPHGLRHSHADLLRRRAFDVEEIRKQLGHRSLEVTSVYLDHLGAHDLPERMRTIGPVLAPPLAPRAELAALLERLGDGTVAQLVAVLRRAVP